MTYVSTHADRILRSILAAALAIAVVQCRSGAEPTPPSFLLIVMDTTRVDAVSAYGRIAGTTPHVDRLAGDGIRYTRAYAQANWTLPSHVTLFTGLLPGQHGVGARATRTPDSLVTIAERLHAAGYDTFGVSENVWVSPPANLAQGFERFVNLPPAGTAVTPTIADWIRERRGDRPFLLFVNVMDAHQPYLVRDRNLFLPDGVSADDARSVSQDVGDYLCSTSRHDREMRILRGLYYGGVAAADAKVGDILQQLSHAGLDRNLVTIITSDHGEHLGEYGLLGHQFSVREQLVHVPLIIHGTTDRRAVIIDDPVQLADVVPTILARAGLAIPPELPGGPLPTSERPPARVRAVVAEFQDPETGPARDDSDLGRRVRALLQTMRRHCPSDQRVFGDMRTLVLAPRQLIWFANYAPELYDLDRDSEEQRDLAGERPEVVAALLGRLEAEFSRPSIAAGERWVPSPEVLRQLRALGYVETDDRGRGEPSPAAEQR